MLVLIALSQFLSVQAAIEDSHLTCSNIDWLRGGDFCGGICSDCGATDWYCKSATAVGPCEGDEAEVFVVTTMEGLMSIDDDDTAYITDSSKYALIDSSTISNGVHNAGVNTNPAYGYSQTGVKLGTSVMGGYLGVAGYIAQEDIATKTNTIRLLDTSDNAVEVGDVCITQINSNTCDGDDRTFSSGEYKFSAFGYTSGTNFVTGASVAYIGIRLKLELHGATTTGISVNNGQSLEDNNLGDVTDILITMSNFDTLNFSFPTKFNIGTIDFAAGTSVTTTETQDAKIKVHTADADSNTFLVDILFPIGGLNAAGKFFIYDPTVTSTIRTATSGTSLLSPALALLMPILAMVFM